MTSVKEHGRVKVNHMKKFITKTFNYSLFDGESGSGADGGSAGQQAVADVKNTGGEKVVYGKQQAVESVAATTDAKPEVKSNPEDFRAKYDEFMKDENMRKFANDDTQKVINRRFRETKALQETVEKQSGIMERLQERYGVSDPEDIIKAIDNDSAIWEDAAIEAGMSVEQFRNFKAIERQAKKAEHFMQQMEARKQANAQYEKWVREANEIKTIYPEFNLEAELQNPDFRNLIGQKNAAYPLSMRQAYEILHHDEIVNGVRQRTADETQKNVVDNIKSRGTRPVEGALSNQGGVVVKSDVSKLTKQDRAEIARRVARGEKIVF